MTIGGASTPLSASYLDDALGDLVAAAARSSAPSPLVRGLIWTNGAEAGYRAKWIDHDFPTAALVSSRAPSKPAMTSVSAACERMLP